MIKHLNFAMAAACAALCLAAPAGAADIDPSYIEGGQGTPVEYGSGWYLRGDIGTFHAAGEGSYGSGGSGTISGADLLSDLSLGVGVGYIFNDRLRADITMNLRDGLNFSGQSGYSDCGGAFTGECGTSDQAEGEALTFEANAYWTLGHWGSLTPYIGGGAGLAMVNWDGESTAVCRLDPGEDCALGNNALAVTTILTDATSTSQSFSTNVLALSAAAGFDYRMSEKWVADFGYKYTRMMDIGLSDDGNRPNLGSANIHEFRAGLRYEIW